MLLVLEFPKDEVRAIYNYDPRTRDPKHLFINYEAVETECRLADCSCILEFLVDEVDG